MDVPDDKTFFERMDARDGMVFEFVSNTEHGFIRDGIVIVFVSPTAHGYLGYALKKEKQTSDTPANHD